ncbi:MAG: carboxypeptidase regulatory-like domain-containing protein [Candidatus Acidiferrales bacterium]
MGIESLLTGSYAQRIRRRFGRAFAFALGMLVLSLPVQAQSSSGRILGDVRDQSDAAIVGANVVITDVQRDVSRSLVTDDAGEYLAPNLAPGIYKITVTKSGFKAFQRTNVQLEVASDLRVDVILQPGDTTQTIVVNEEVPLLNTTSATLGGTLSNQEINDLPLNGRNYENLLQLRPGVVRYPGGGFSTTSTDGLRAEDNVYVVDGLFNSEPFSGQSIINGAGIAGDSATILPIDAIQEFNLIENPPAEYGWKPGAIVNVGLKSGTNDLHGSAYAFGRSQSLDARNYFNDVGSPQTPTQLEQFGGTVGGPIVKDKVFFFGGYEGQRYTVGNSFQVQSPLMISSPTNAGNCTFISSGDCANSIPDAIADLQAHGIPVSNVSLKVSGCTVGPPVSCNGKGFPTNDGANGTTITTGFPNVVSADNAVGKIDYHINDHHTLSGMYFFGNNSGTVDDAIQLQPQWLTLIHTRAQVFGLNWTWVPNSRWVNEARFGYNRLTQPTYSADHNESAASLGIDDGVTNPLYGGLPRLKIKGFGGLFETLGGFKWPKFQGPDQRYQFVDHVSYIVGKHALKFGAEVHRDSFSGGAFGDGKGYIIFSGNNAFAGSTVLEDFLAGDPGGSVPFPTHALVGDTPIRHIHNFSEGVFAQDDWRITNNLTLNLGLRYEYNGVISENNNLLGNFSPTEGLVQVGQQIGQPYHGNHTNFAPRLGVAWDPFGTGKTVIRAGGGLIYETVNWESFMAFNNVYGLGTIPTGGILNGVQGTGTITAGVQNIPNPPTPWDTWGVSQTPPFQIAKINCQAALGQTCSILGVNPNITTPYVTNWTLNVQHAFTNALSLEVAYVGNHGTNLMGIRDINQPAVGSGWSPGATSSDPVAEQAARPFTVNGLFPYLANIYQMANIYESNYNGLQATLTGREYHHFTFVAGYTYSHSLDDVGANWDFGAGLGLPQDATHPGREYASSDFDIRNRFTLSMVYSIPGKKSFAQLLEGWQLISIVSLYSPQPWGPMDTGDDISGTGEGVDRWDFVGNPNDFKSGPTSIPYYAPGSPQTSPGGICSNAASTPALQTSLGLFGCYAEGNSAMIPPALGTFGTMGRNVFRDSGFRNWDFSVAKNWTFKERFGAQFRAEFFNVLNHPNFANPYGGQNGFGMNDPSVLGPGFGCGCATPDVAASNPVLGSGGNRAVQLGLKLSF